MRTGAKGCRELPQVAAARASAASPRMVGIGMCVKRLSARSSIRTQMKDICLQCEAKGRQLKTMHWQLNI